MAIAVDPKQSFPYVLKEDRALPSSEQTVWKLQAPTTRHEKDATLESQRSGVHAAIYLCRYRISGWENYRVRRDDGQIVAVEAEFAKDGGLTDKVLDLIPLHWKIELSDAIYELGKPSESDKGN